MRTPQKEIPTIQWNVYVGMCQAYRSENGGSNDTEEERISVTVEKSAVQEGRKKSGGGGAAKWNGCPTEEQRHGMNPDFDIVRSILYVQKCQRSEQMQDECR